MRRDAKLVNFVQVSAGTLAGIELVRQETGKRRLFGVVVRQLIV